MFVCDLTHQIHHDHVVIGGDGGFLKEGRHFELRGRDLVTGLPKDITITSNEIAEALNPLLIEIAHSIQNVFNVTPPELVADIMEKGIILSGGSVQLHHLPEFLERFLGVQAYVAEDPLFCVAKGTGIAMEHLDVYKKTIIAKK